MHVRKAAVVRVCCHFKRFNKKFQGYLGRAASPTITAENKTTPQTPRCLQWDAPLLPPKLPLIFDDHPLSTDPTHHAKRHPDPISRFATEHFPDTHTDQQTDRQNDMG